MKAFTVTKIIPNTNTQVWTLQTSNTDHMRLLGCDIADVTSRNGKLIIEPEVIPAKPVVKLQNNWLPVIGSLLSTLQKAGFVLTSVNNMEDHTTLTGTPRQRRQKAKAEINATDESRLYVTFEGRTFWLFIVLGNFPEETVCDYTSHDELDKVLDTWSASWAGRGVPKKEVQS